MIYFVHRGGGGRYSADVLESIRKIARKRQAIFTKDQPARGGFVVAINQAGRALTADLLAEILRQHDVTFLVGDSNGLSAAMMSGADCIVRLTDSPVSHQCEALILSEQLERNVKTE